MHHSSPLFYSYFYFSLIFFLKDSFISSPVIKDLSTIIIARAAAQIPRALTKWTDATGTDEDLMYL